MCKTIKYTFRVSNVYLFLFFLILYQFMYIYIKIFLFLKQDLLNSSNKNSDARTQYIQTCIPLLCPHHLTLYCVGSEQAHTITLLYFPSSIIFCQNVFQDPRDIIHLQRHANIFIVILNRLSMEDRCNIHQPHPHKYFEMQYKQSTFLIPFLSKMVPIQQFYFTVLKRFSLFYNFTLQFARGHVFSSWIPSAQILQNSIAVGTMWCCKHQQLRLLSHSFSCAIATRYFSFSFQRNTRPFCEVLLILLCNYFSLNSTKHARGPTSQR